MTLYYIKNGDGAAKVRAGINDNTDELLGTRRVWHPDFRGSYCTYNGRDYDLAPGGVSTETPGNPDHWKEHTVTVENLGGAGMQYKRGTYAELQAMPANTLVELFTVEGEVINAYNEDVNGRYWRTAANGQYIWVREA